VAAATPVGETKFIVPSLLIYGESIFPFDRAFCGNSLICDHTGTIFAMADDISDVALCYTCSTVNSQQMKMIDFCDYGVNQIKAYLTREVKI